jgi:transposase InsO family protein
MLKKAIKKENIKNDLILHSDQGWHYQHFGYQRLLKENGIKQSMSRKGNCLDNAVMENFFGHLKAELLYIQKFTSIEHFKSELISYIDWYNNKRAKAKFGYISPLEYRNQAA